MLVQKFINTIYSTNTLEWMYERKLIICSVFIMHGSLGFMVNNQSTLRMEPKTKVVPKDKGGYQV